MSLSIVVNGGGTFTASMEEGPVSFTASLAAVGPAGPDGAAGPGVAVGGTTGEVLAKASGTDYDTEWVARNPFNQELNTTDSVSFQNINAGVGDFSDISIGGSINYLGGSINFSDNTSQSTALPSGIADGYIVSWDEDTATYLSVPNDARTLFITARNITGTTIPKGTVVLITGASGNRPTIGLAQGDTGANADGVIGITDAAIDNNANGRVITEGLADNLDTSAFAAGDKLFLSAVTPGGLVNVRPVQPAHSVAVGVVTRSNNAVGSIEVKIQVGEHLEFLHDVLLTSKANGDFLVYESSTDLWKNRTLASLDLLTATAAAAVYQPLSGMGSYLTTSAAASTYAPIASPTFTGTVTIPAGASISGFAPLDSPALTGTPTAPTAAATTDTTQVATTAFVQQEVPAASTTAAGKVELATDAEAITGTDTSRAITAKHLRKGLISGGYIWLNPSRASFSTSGTGASAAADGGTGIIVSAPTSLAGHGRASFSIRNVRRGGSFAARAKFNEPSIFSARINGNAISADSGSVFRMSVGKVGSPANGDIVSSDQAAQIKIAGGVMTLLVANGTTLTTTTLSNTPPDNLAFDVEIVMDGAGNAEVFVDGSSVGTSTGAPTSNTTTNAGGMLIQFESVNDSTISATRAAFIVSNCFFYTPA